MVGRQVVADADARVEKDAAGLGERVVGVDEATLGAFEMMSREGVCDGAEAECR